MERLKLATLYDVVGKESKGVFLGANDFTLGSEEPSQYYYLAPGITKKRRLYLKQPPHTQLILSFGALWPRHLPYPFDILRRAVMFSDVLRPFSNVAQPLLERYTAITMQLVNH